MNANFTTPVIRTADPQDWYVFFEFFHGGKWLRRKIRQGINRFADLKERRKEAEALRAATEAKLKLGWNPVTDPEFKARAVAQTVESIENPSFNDALNFAFAKKVNNLAKKTRQDYRNILEIIKDHARTIGLAYVPIKEIKRIHILNLLESLSEKRSFSNHRYNMYLGCLRAMLTELETWTVIEYNPASKIPTKQVAESNFYESFTPEEKARIAEYLAAKHYQLFVFMQFIYDAGIRPKELLSLRVGQIDLKRRIMTLEPDKTEETTKTPFVRRVPISNALWPFISEMYLSRYAPEFYVFGSPFEPGKGNRGAFPHMAKKGNRLVRENLRNGFEVDHGGRGVMGAMRGDYLTPSPWKASRDTVSSLWNKLVKKDLGINKCLYAAKHTGANDKILAGIDLDALRNLYGHRSKQMTENYAKQIREAYNSEIIKKSPSFTGKGKIRKIA